MELTTCPNCGNVYDGGCEDYPPVVNGNGMCHKCFEEEIVLAGKSYYKGYHPFACGREQGFYFTFDDPDELIKKVFADKKYIRDGCVLTKSLYMNQNMLCWQRLLFANYYIVGTVYNYDLNDLNIPVFDANIYTHGVGDRKKVYEWLRGQIVVENKAIRTTDEEITALAEQCPVDVDSFIDDMKPKVPFNKQHRKCTFCGTEITRDNLCSFILLDNGGYDNYDKLVCDNKACVVKAYVDSIDRY